MRSFRGLPLLALLTASLAMPAFAAVTPPVATPPAVTTPAVSPDHDQALLQELAAAQTGLDPLFLQLYDLNPALVSGDRLPTWEDIQALTTLVQQAKAIKAEVLPPEQEKKLQAALSDAADRLAKDDAFRRLRNVKRTEQINPSSYQPTEYELKEAYRSLLGELNGVLPPTLQFQLQDLPESKTGPLLADQGRRLVQNQEVLLAKLLPTTGFPTLAEYNQAVALQGAGAARARDIVVGEKIDLTMNRPEGARWWVTRTGLQNQFVTGTSQGFLGALGRNACEASMTGMSLADYSAHDNNWKPKYGQVQARLDTGLIRNTGASHYGADIYYLRLESVRDRLTWYLGDSLDRILYAPGGVLSGNVYAPAKWDQIFFPWSARELMVPYLLTYLSQNMFKLLEPNPGSIALPAKTPGATPETLLDSGWFIDNTYVEFQLWGPLTLDDIEAFEFTTTPPSGDFLQALLDRKIMIRDARQNPPVPWTPSAAVKPSP